MSKNRLQVSLIFFLITGFSNTLFAQATVEDYKKAQELWERFDGKIINSITGEPEWLEDEPIFWYRKSIEGGHEFIRVDAEASEKGPAFNHARLASSLSEITEESYTAKELPFNSFEYKNNGQSIEVSFDDTIFTCTLGQYECEGREDTSERPNWQWGIWDHESKEVDVSASDSSITSPNEKWEAYIQNYNIVVKRTGSDEVIPLSQDGSENNYYNFNSISWSPDSEKLAVYRVIPGYDRKVHYVESSPESQLQPKHLSRTYVKPGDVLDKEQPVLFHVERGEQFHIDSSLFPNAFSQTGLRWREDSEALTFEYNERGHQRYRIIEVNAENGETRTIINEEPETFFSYATSLFRHYTEEGDEIIWMSERDGWRHLYLYDTATGEVKNQITEGEWVVREVEYIDEENRQIWFQASGVDEDQDPYYIHYFRVNFDGSDLTRFTQANGDHEVVFSSDREYYVDTWSQIDKAPVSELRKTSDQSLVMVLEEADISSLVEAGWQAPEQFVAKGRDGETDIYGIIIKPTHFDSSKEYPVIEYIYAGPHDNFVPKSFLPFNHMMKLAEMGFIVVQIDGMGTANRSKAFHDVAWRNLKDAGFPDRILWHEAVAETYSWYDNSKVGIYGRSAGGQSSLGALLFHPEYYHVAVSSVGCHDNRMDKIWWNEQWMGWPIGPHYAASSNVENAHKLQGNVLLIVGELDTNVDPSSTYQVADALIKANKDFDFLAIPGAGHGSVGEYEERKRFDYFLQHLKDVDTPNWNQYSEI